MSDIDDKQKKIRYAAYEIIDTEKTYLSRLKAVHEVYALPLKDLNILDNKDWELQFGCWDELYKISKNFYEKLGPQRDSLTPKIGKVFLEFCEVNNSFYLF
jgi:tyrosyl-tRNA synthetase